ncbi:hypothetical protein GDO81_014627 [Engystomops pustulosus]|uniref:Uncharacterized protein n=1 Tax=Engystomops pustulosus TaxID=76066 RepID=A0AAV7BBP8_ENGPU|nr:hypothetical protein GDO81_014627 [Engystomops pustulosus]
MMNLPQCSCFIDALTLSSDWLRWSHVPTSITKRKWCFFLKFGIYFGLFKNVLRKFSHLDNPLSHIEFVFFNGTLLLLKDVLKGVFF